MRGATLSCLTVLAVGLGLMSTSGAGEPPRSRNFLFTYAATVKGLTPGSKARIWLPLPQNTSVQTVKIQEMDLPGKESIARESQYGNQILYVEGVADKDGKVSLKLGFLVTRNEVRTNGGKFSSLQPGTNEKITRFLEPDAKVPISGKPLELIKDVKLPGDQVATAKVLYDIVNQHMKYSKEGTGWGQGDAVWACDSKFGNCSDFHSLFISLMRAQKIPCKFEMGFPVPAKRGQGPVGGYHCWAWFLSNSHGWVPVDISEANRFPELKDYYFGNLTEDRVQFATGRDINLVPQQKGPPLNFFIYPYVEVNDQPLPADKIDRAFAYQDVASAK